MNRATAQMEQVRLVTRTGRLTALVTTLLATGLLASPALAQPAPHTSLPSTPSVSPSAGTVTPGSGLDQHVSIPASAFKPDFKRVILGKKAVYKLCPTCSNIDVGSGSATDLTLQELQTALAQAQQTQAKLDQMIAAVQKSEEERQKWLDGLAGKLLGVAQQLAHKSSASYKEPSKPASAEDAVDSRITYVCKQVGAACQ